MTNLVNSQQAPVNLGILKLEFDRKKQVTDTIEIQLQNTHLNYTHTCAYR